MPARLPHPALVRSLGRCLFERAALSSSSSSSPSSSPCRASSGFAIASSSSSPSTSSKTYASSRLRLGQSSASFHTSSVYAAVGGDLKLELPADYVPPTQPPSAKRPDLRKTQLLRQYTSMMRTTPLMLLFQHNNLTGAEWSALRRELNLAARRVSEDQKALGIEWPERFGDNIRIQVIRTRIFDLALRLTEFYDPSTVTAESTAAVVRGRGKAGAVYNHDVSDAAAAAVKQAEADGLTASEKFSYAQLKPLLMGPLVLLTFPDVSPAHLAAALSILAPSPPQFPAPSRKKNPGFYDPLVQSALPKLLLIGGRVEGKAFDSDGLKWVGTIEGGRAGLQAQLVHMLQSAGLGLTAALEGASKSLWLTMESRKVQLEDEGKLKVEEAAEGAAEVKEEAK